MGEFLPARDHLQRAISLYDLERHRQLTFRYFPVDARVMCLSYAAWTLWYLGYPDQALNTVNEASALARRLSHGFSLGLAEMGACVLHLLYEKPAPLNQTRRMGLRFLLSTGWPTFWHGQLRCAAGRSPNKDAPKRGLCRFRKA
jgi:hypothetical protein